MVADQVLLSASSDPLLPASYVCARDLDGSQVTQHAQARQRHVASHWSSGQASSADVHLSAQAAWLLASQALSISPCCAYVPPTQQIAVSKQQVAIPWLSIGSTVQTSSLQKSGRLKSDAVPADHGHAPEFNVSTHGGFPSPSRDRTSGACESVCAVWHYKDSTVARGASW